MSDVDEMGAGGVAGMQLPIGIKSRKKHVDEVLGKHPDIGHGVMLAFLGSLDDQSSPGVEKMLDDGDYDGVADQAREHAAREVVRNKMREVVRKKAGGGGYVLYAPNKGKKGKPRGVGTFPTKLGAKRAELARFPPKDAGKLKRLRKDVDKLSKDPKKAAEKEKQAAKAKPFKKKTESLQLEALPSLATPTGTTGPTSAAAQKTNMNQPEISKDVATFGQGLKKLAPQSPERTNYLVKHANDAGFMTKLKAQSPDQASMLTKLAFKAGDQSARVKPGQAVTRVGNSSTSTLSGDKSVNATRVEARQAGSFGDLMERKVLSVIIKRSLVENLFREEKTESEWDDYVGKLSKKALAGDSKFQKLQSNISKRTDVILKKAIDSIKKAVGKGAKVKSYDVKHDPQAGETYLPFSIDLDGSVVEPIYVRVQGGVPKIEISSQAKAALTKAEPDSVKMLRAELVMVQERVLDEMDDLQKAVQARDKYLQKMEDEVDGYVAALTPLQISLMKKLLVQKYRKTA